MIVIRETPIPYVRQTRADAWKKRPAVLKYRAYRDAVRMKANGYKPQDGEIIHFYLPMPKSWSKKKRAEMSGKLHKQKPDLDNLAKAFWDCFGEDSHLSSVTLAKFWTPSEEGQIQVSLDGDDGKVYNNN